MIDEYFKLFRAALHASRAITQRHTIDTCPGVVLARAETGLNVLVEGISLIVWAAQHSQ
jgi:hypothetical protein